MELMPHIKALLDDLIKMTKHIDVKRTDLADRYEDNSRTLLLYQQVTEILHGMPTFYTYTVYPKEVLSSYGKWVKTEDKTYFGVLEPLTSSKNNKISKMLTGSNMIISNDTPRENGSIGDGWVKLSNNGRFYPVKKYKVNTKTFDYVITNPDSEGNYNRSDIVPSIIFTGNIYTIKNRFLYIKDVKYNKYIKINVSFMHEYIEKPDNMEDFLTKSDNSSFTYDIVKDSNTNEYKYVEYVENIKNDNEMIIYDSTDNNRPILDPEKIYLFRYKILFYFADDYYNTNDEVYYETNYKIDSSKYSRVDNNEYYQSSKGVYSLLYVKNEDGNYIYDTENSEFIYLENTEEIDASELYSKEIENPETIYYRYIDHDAGLVQQETYQIDDEPFYRFESSSDGNFVTYYNYTDEETYNKCVISIESESIENEFKTYISTDNYEILVKDNNLYYLYKDNEGMYRLETNNENKVYVYNTIFNTGEIRYSMTQKPPVDDISYDSCVYINESSNNEYYTFERVFTDNQVNTYYRDRNKIPDINYIDINGKERNVRDDLKNVMRDYIMNLYCPDYYNNSYSVPIYTGETNRYYRELNGLPPLNVSLSHPKIDRYTINPYYEGTNTKPYLYELTDAEVDKMEELGYLKQYQDMYPDYTYLHHLGKHRIDVITARSAAPYDILYLNESEMNITSEMFITNYSIAKNYIFKKYYKPNMFGKHQYYHSYIGFNICLLTLIMCMVKSGEILIENKFVDQETVDLILKSYGFDHTFDSIPLVYRREIAKNILRLIRNKGIDKIYEVVYDIFNMSDIEVYKYYFKKSISRNSDNQLLYYLVNKTTNELLIDDVTNEKVKITKLEYDNTTKYKMRYNLKPVYDIGVSQVPISSNNIVKDIITDSNILNYDDITYSDKYWGVYESDESVKNKILDIPFNYMNSKYITLNNKFNLTELNFNSAYLLNYFIDTTALNGNVINIDIEELNNPQNIKNLLIMLFAIQSIKFGFDGNIPSDIVSAATVYKFNLDESVVGIDGESGRIIDYYLNYMTQNGAIDVLDINSQMIDISQENNKVDSIKGSIYNDKNNKSVDDLAKTYLKNLSKDDSLTSLDESSIYNKLVSCRENSKTISDFMCFDNLLHCISVCNETQKAYEFANPIWETMYECKYSHSGFIEDKYELVKNSEKMYYTDILQSWNLLDSTDKADILYQLDNDCQPKKMIRLDDSTYLDIGEYILSKESRLEKNSDGKYVPVYDILHKSENGEYYNDENGYYYNKTDIVTHDNNIYYEHFLNAKNVNAIISTKNAISYDFNIDKKLGLDDKRKLYVVNINNISRSELLKTENILMLMDKIDVYVKENLFDKDDGLDLDGYINDLIYSDINHISKSRSITSTNIGVNNNAYIGHITLDEFILSAKDKLTSNSPIMYVEVLKDNSVSENIYNVKIYKKCKYALTYSMYLRENAEELYEYLQVKPGETEIEYKNRIDKFSSTIIATIENNIKSKKIKDEIHLSYADFSNISKYIRLILNVFKSYSVDLSSMDIIYNINDKNKNRFKMIDTFSSNEKYGIKSNIGISSDISYNEQSVIKDVISIKDEIFIETHSRDTLNI